MKYRFRSFPAILLLTLAFTMLISNTGLISSVFEQTKQTKEELSNITSIIKKANSEPQKVDSDIEIPDYSGEAFIEINDNVPMFSSLDIANAYENDEYISYIKLSELDELGRAQTAMMSAGPETLADEERGSIGMIKPSGWKQARYDDLIEDKYLYNRCHLLAHNLSEFNAEERNLITGTRQMNIGAMLDYEIKVAEYIKNTQNHVLYRVTPIYEGNNLLAKGVLMEGLSLEESGLEFCVFVYNVQDGIDIDYATGDSWRK